MLKPKQSRSGFYYPLLTNPVSRVLKFRNVVRYLNELPQAELVLDYGAGDRPYETMLLQKYDRYIAADYAAANEAHAQRPDCYIEDYHIDMDSGQADCVFFTEVMEHIYDPKRALTEIHRILKPGGFVVGSVPFAIGEHEKPYDFHRYTSFCLQQLFEDTGYEVKRLEYVGDMVGVAALLHSHVFAIMNKAGKKLKVSWLTRCLHQIFRIPEFFYFGLIKIGLSPSRISYYRNYPFGFTFLLEKK